MGVLPFESWKMSEVVSIDNDDEALTRLRFNMTLNLKQRIACVIISHAHIVIS
jgi:hypothetical protein